MRLFEIEEKEKFKSALTDFKQKYDTIDVDDEDRNEILNIAFKQLVKDYNMDASDIIDFKKIVKSQFDVHFIN